MGGTYTHTRARTQTRMHTRASPHHTHARARAHAHTHITRAKERANVLYVHTCIQTDVYVHAHTYNLYTNPRANTCTNSSVDEHT